MRTYRGVMDVEDEKIVELYWSRNENAIEETDSKYGRYLFRIAYNVLANRQDCMESVNDTYLAAWDSMPPHKPSKLSLYLAKLTRRISIDLYRKNHRQKRTASEYALSLSELGENLADTHTVDEKLQLRQLGEALNHFLRSLPEQDRTLFICRYYFLDPIKNVAAICGLSESNAKTRLFRIRGCLRNFLREEGFEL